MKITVEAQVVTALYDMDAAPFGTRFILVGDAIVGRYEDGADGAPPPLPAGIYTAKIDPENARRFAVSRPSALSSDLAPTESLVLDTIRRHGPCTTHDISKRIGYIGDEFMSYRYEVSKITRRLRGEGRIIPNSPGRYCSYVITPPPQKKDPSP